MSTNVNATSPSSPLITIPPSNTDSSISNNSSGHGPDGQAVGNDHVLPSPPPSTSNYSINSSDGSPPDHATGNSTTSEGHLTWGSTWIQPLVAVVAALVITQLMSTSSSIPWWSATSIAVCVLFTRAATFHLVTVVTAELLVITHAVVFLFIIGTIVALLRH